MGLAHPVPLFEGGRCLQCMEKAAAFEQEQERRMEEADRIFEQILHQEMTLSRHMKLRCFERSFALPRLKTCLEDGLPISLYKSGSEYHLVVLSAVKEGREYRPIHICLAAGRHGVVIKTVYDPRTRRHQWDSTYSKKICWCTGGYND